MSQSPSVESSTRTLPTPSINPVLQAAMSSLDVELEEELARYRRQRAGRPVSSARGLGRHQTHKPIELISVNTANKVERPVTTTEFKSSLSPESDAPTSTAAKEPLSFQITLAKNAAPAADNPAIGNANQELGTAQPGTGVGVDSISPSETQSSPDDYLESSEQLLRSLAEEEAVPAKRSFLDNLLSPLGVGSILLFLLGSATVGYIVMNPSSWSELGLDRFWKRQTPTVAQSPAPAVSPTDTQPQASPILNGPNLASEEFVDLNLNTLSRLKTDPSPISQVPRQPLPRLAAGAANLTRPSGATVGGRPSDLASAILPPTLSSGPVPPPVPSVAPIPIPPAPNLTTATRTASGARLGVGAAQGKDLYYVLTNYEGDRSLELARKIVADAYVRNFSGGARIQVATFTKESQARRLVRELKQQGIGAWVYHP